MIEKPLKPFLKWAGGKKWLVSKSLNIIPQTFNNYFEPFIGGGALFFRLSPQRGIISDINSKLMNVYTQMRDNPDILKEKLAEYQLLHNKEFYNQIRKHKTDSDLENGYNLLYLNRSCFNGLYRENKKGEFNVPMGSKTNFTYDIHEFCTYSEALKKIEIRACDFSETIPLAGQGDFVFADPPYATAIKQDKFIKYNDKLFSWADQKRLLDDLISARNRGAYVLATNVNFPDIYEMYLANGFHITVVYKKCNIAANSQKRKQTEELLITSYPVTM